MRAAPGARDGYESGWHTMIQRSKRGYAARATTLLGTVLVHALIIHVILTNSTKVFTSNSYTAEYHGLLRTSSATYRLEPAASEIGAQAYGITETDVGPPRCRYSSGITCTR